MHGERQTEFQLGRVGIPHLYRDRSGVGLAFAPDRRADGLAARSHVSRTQNDKRMRSHRFLIRPCSALPSPLSSSRCDPWAPLWRLRPASHRVIVIPTCDPGLMRRFIWYRQCRPELEAQQRAGPQYRFGRSTVGSATFVPGRIYRSASGGGHRVHPQTTRSHPSDAWSRISCAARVVLVRVQIHLDSHGR